MATVNHSEKTESIHQFSTVGFKTARADLHRQSRYIFAGALVVSIVITLMILIWPFTVEKTEKVLERIPVVMLVESVPEIEHRVEGPAPPAPFTPAAEPIPVDDILLDDVTIEDTAVTFDEPSSAPVVAAQGEPQESTENMVFDFFAVEEPPERKSSVTPYYPPIAARAGIGGLVTIKVLVNTEGVVDSVAVVDGPEILLESAIEAASTTTFTPARHNNRPVDCWVILTFRFTAP